MSVNFSRKICCALAARLQGPFRVRANPVDVIRQLLEDFSGRQGRIDIEQRIAEELAAKRILIADRHDAGREALKEPVGHQLGLCVGLRGKGQADTGAMNFTHDGDPVERDRAGIAAVSAPDFDSLELFGAEDPDRTGLIQEGEQLLMPAALTADALPVDADIE